ncbi:MAG: glycosyltransferase family 2 protein [Planctomycetia bacterium]|nr:glycosyltransferase family 2 protein [Planctomycetia bacterium]
MLNEVDSLRQLHAELSDVAKAERYDLEIIFIDDGSSDGSWELIRKLSADDPRVRGIRFRRNFGKAAALRAGFEASHGDFIMTLDADLQDDPHEIPNFLAEMKSKNLDVVSGWKQVRHDPWHKVGPSRIFNRLVGYLTGVRLHDHNCGMKCYRRAVVQEVRIYGELHRFIPVLAHARGFRVGEIAIQHRARQFGHSKYGFRRFFKGFLDLLTVTFLTGFGHRPQHLLGTLGLICFFVGGLGMTWLAWFWVASVFSGIDPKLHQRPALLYSIAAFLIGGQFMSIGFLAELMTAHQGNDLDTFSISEVTTEPIETMIEG